MGIHVETKGTIWRGAGVRQVGEVALDSDVVQLVGVGARSECETRLRWDSADGVTSRQKTRVRLIGSMATLLSTVSVFVEMTVTNPFFASSCPSTLPMTAAREIG